MTAAMENHLESKLSSLLTPPQLKALLKSSAAVNQLPEHLTATVLSTFADGFLLRMKITLAFSAAQFFAIGLVWSKPQILVKR